MAVVGPSQVTETVKGRYWASGIFLLAALLALLLPLIVPTATCKVGSRTATEADVNFASQSCPMKMSGLNPAITWTPCLLVLMALAIQLPYLLWLQAEHWLGIDLVGAVQALGGSSAHPGRRVKYVLRALRTGRRHMTSILLLLRKAITVFTYVFFFILIHALANPFSIDILTEMSSGSEDPLRFAGSSCYNHVCVYPANLILRQVYIILILVLLIFIIFDSADLFLWVMRLFSKHLQDRKIAECIQDAEERAKQAEAPESGAAAKPDDAAAAAPLDGRFASYLGSDGVLLLNLSHKVASLDVWESLVLHVWEDFQLHGGPAELAGGESEGDKLLKHGSDTGGEKASLKGETEKGEELAATESKIDVEATPEKV